MSVFEQFPYTNFHNLNLDWILKALSELKTQVSDFVSINAIKYADPIQWNITSQYEKNTVVLDMNGNAYLSVQAVPSGVSIDRTEFWTVIGNFSALWSGVKTAITNADEGHSTTATKTRKTNDLVWLNDDLIEMTTDITAGTAYIIGINCRKISMQILLSEIQTAINNETAQREDKDGELQTNINNETQERKSEYASLQSQIDDKTNDISGLDTRIHILEDRKFLLIGDSYAGGEGADGPITGWIQHATQFMGLTGNDFFAMPQGGHGFYSDGNNQNKFLTDLQSKLPLMGDLTKYTDIVVCAGFNDTLASAENVESAISDFCAYVKTHFENAKISIGMVGWAYLTQHIESLARTKIAYQQCGKYGASYMTNIEYSLHDYRMFQSDNYHPNASGQISIAKNVVNYLKSGCCSVSLVSNYSTLALDNGMTSASPTTIYETLNDGSITTFPTSWDIVFEPELTLLTKKLGTLSKLYLMGMPGYTSIPVQLYLYGTIGSVAVYAGTGHILVNGGVVTLQIDYPIMNGTIISDVRLTHITINFPTYTLPSMYA